MRYRMTRTTMVTRSAVPWLWAEGNRPADAGCWGPGSENISRLFQWPSPTSLIYLNDFERSWVMIFGLLSLCLFVAICMLPPHHCWVLASSRFGHWPTKNYTYTSLWWHCSVMLKSHYTFSTRKFYPWACFPLKAFMPFSLGLFGHVFSTKAFHALYTRTFWSRVFH